MEQCQHQRKYDNVEKVSTIKHSWKSRFWFYYTCSLTLPFFLYEDNFMWMKQARNLRIVTPLFVKFRTQITVEQFNLSRSSLRSRVSWYHTLILYWSSYFCTITFYNGAYCKIKHFLRRRHKGPENYRFEQKSLNFSHLQKDKACIDLKRWHWHLTRNMDAEAAAVKNYRWNGLGSTKHTEVEKEKKIIYQFWKYVSTILDSLALLISYPIPIPKK